jgi:hypothetical protein
MKSGERAGQETGASCPRPISVQDNFQTVADALECNVMEHSLVETTCEHAY